MEAKTGKCTNGENRKQKTAANQNRTAAPFGNLEVYGMEDGDPERTPCNEARGSMGVQLTEHSPSIKWR